MYNFKCNFQSSPSRYSPKNKFKKKLKFNDISDSVQSSADDFEFYNNTDYNNVGSFKDNPFDYDLSNIKSEIDIEEHELPVIKQELETDSSSSSPKRRKQKLKESSDNVKTEQNQNLSNSGSGIKLKKSRTHSESDTQTEDHHNHKSEKKKRKKDKKLLALNDEDNHSLETETDSSLSSEKSKKREAKELFVNSETDSALDGSLSKKRKKNKKKQTDSLNETNRDHEKEKNNDEKLETHMNSSSSPTKSDKKKEASGDNTENSLESKLSEDNVENPKKKKKKKKKKMAKDVGNDIDTERNDDNDKIELKTNSLNINEIDGDLHPEEANKKKKKHKEKKQKVNNHSNPNMDQEQDNGVETDTKTTSPTDDNNEIELETNSLNSNEMDTDLRPEKAKKKKKKHKEKKQDNVDNNQSNSDVHQDQDNGIETESQTTPPTASNSNVETQDENDDENKNHETALDKNCFEMNSSSDDDSDSEYERLRESTRRKKSMEVADNKKKIAKPKNKINIISNRLINKSSTPRRNRKKSIFAQKYEEYSSNDEPDNHLKPKVDHNTTLQDVLDQSQQLERDDYNIVEQVGEIHVIIPFEVPRLHTIESCGFSPLTNEHKEEISALGLQMKLGVFSKKEDNIILANWKDFCKMHDLPEDPQPFVKINVLKKIMSVRDRLDFFRFLARNLNDRTLYSVYYRFRRLMERKMKRFGKFTPEEDRIILDYLKRTTESHPYRKLAIILNRDSALIHKRVKKLKDCTETNDIIKWDKELLENVVKNLLKVTKTNNTAIFEKRPITFNEWEQVSKIMKIPVLKLKYAWHHRIYRELFYAYDEYSTADIRIKLINKLHEMNVTDFRTINWIQLAKDFDGLSSANLCACFHHILTYHVPRNYKEDPTACLNYMHSHLVATYPFADKKVQKLYLNV